MPALKTWRVRDSGGDPDPTATPQILAFVDRAGAPLTPQPPVLNLGAGEFGIQPNASQENFGLVYLIDNGPTAFTRYEFGHIVAPTALPIESFLWLDSGGDLWSGGGTPSLAAVDGGLYVDPASTPRTPPTPVDLYNGALWCISPTQADIDAGGCAFVIIAPDPAALPDSYDGSLTGIPSTPPPAVPGGTIVDVLGVLETGATRAADVPANVRKTLQVVIGMTLALRFRCVRPDSSQVTSGTFEFSVAKRTGDSFRNIKKTVTAAASVIFAIAPNETKPMSPGLYAWDIWYIDGTGARSPVVPPSPLKLEAAATPPP